MVARDVTRGTRVSARGRLQRVWVSIERSMVKRCVAAGCSNTYSSGVSLFYFPKDQAKRLLWTRQVQRTRAEWKGPSEHSVLCSDHFTDDCFEPAAAIASSLGLAQPRRRLKADAVPTVFVRRASASDDSGTGSNERWRGAGKQLSSEGPGCSSTGGCSRNVKRGAFEKRERARVNNHTLTLLTLKPYRL